MAFLDHIGIAVNPTSRLAEVLAILDLPATGKEIVAREKVETEWIPLPEKSGHIELLRPTEADSVIAKFLAKNGKDGIHHLCFRVDDIEGISQRFLAAGFTFVYPSAKSGAHNCLVNFLHPQGTGGVLVEISQKL